MSRMEDVLVTHACQDVLVTRARTNSNSQCKATTQKTNTHRRGTLVVQGGPGGSAAAQIRILNMYVQNESIKTGAAWKTVALDTWLAVPSWCIWGHGRVRNAGM